MDIRKHIEDAIKKAGSETKLGEATGYSQHAIWKAKTRGKVTPDMALAIHWALSGAVPASSLCPHLWESPKDVPPPPKSRERVA